MKSLMLTMSDQRLSPVEYLGLCWTHFKAHWWQYCVPVMAVLLLQTVVRLDVNYTESLPDHVFLTIKGWKTGLKHGDYVTYAFPTVNPDSPFRKGDHMVKMIAGVGGDEVFMADSGEFYIRASGTASVLPDYQGHPVGRAKPISRAGKPLEHGPVGVIPQGSYYVYAPHKDSLDSRYAMVGWVQDRDLIGRTFPLF